MLKAILCIAALGYIATPSAIAHGGGLNAQGCHTNRKTGEYHCHRSSAAPAPRPAPAQQQLATTLTPPPSSAAGVTRPYRNCTEARAAGAAPVLRGEPGYGAHLDRDNDGIGCE